MSEVISEQEAISQPEVICERNGPLGRLTLNRPDALHSLNPNMCQLMINALQAWQHDDSVKAIWIDHQPGTRGFCAGGDIRLLSESGQKDGVEAWAFFRLEYQLNHYLHSYPKPVIAVIDGVTMGGGVGISVHGRYRIATENTTFAMPETGIALMPDVGGGWFLPRLDGEIGTWLAMTGSRLKAADTNAAGIATHYVGSQNIAALMDSVKTCLSENADLHACLDAAQENPGEIKQLDDATRNIIDRCFAYDRAEDIIAALTKENSPWAEKQLTTMASKSPQSIKIALKQMRLGAAMETFADNMAMEFTAVCRVVIDKEFHEGVRAVIVDKDNAPNWHYASVSDVPDDDVEAVFAPLPEDRQWHPLPQALE